MFVIKVLLVIFPPQGAIGAGDQENEVDEKPVEEETLDAMSSICRKRRFLI